jgi:hypothetical protein
MSYPRLQSHSNYFIPAGSAALDVETLSATAAVHGQQLCKQRCVVRRLKFIVTTAVVATSTAPVVDFKLRSAPGVTAGQVSIGSLTIPNGTAAGTVVYKDIEPVVVEVGQAIALDHTVQTVGGTVAGAGFYAMEAMDSPEVPVNEAKMLASA